MDETQGRWPYMYQLKKDKITKTNSQKNLSQVRIKYNKAKEHHEYIFTCDYLQDLVNNLNYSLEAN
jgi:hypothetical protein